MDKQTLLGLQALENSTILLYFQAERGDYTLLHLTGEGYSSASSQGIVLGDAPEAVERAYGTPPRRVQTSGGEFWVYPIRKLLFRFDTKKELVQWGAYRQSD